MSHFPQQNFRGEKPHLKLYVIRTIYTKSFQPTTL